MAKNTGKVREFCLSGKVGTLSEYSLKNFNNIHFCRSMKGRIKAQMFSFDQLFQIYQKNDFVLVCN